MNKWGLKLLLNMQEDMIIDFVDIINCPVLYLKQCFSDWTPPPSSGKKSTQLGQTHSVSLSPTGDSCAPYIELAPISEVS
jgi:hypothetical protein